MNGPDILASLRDELAIELQFHVEPAAKPLAISPWLAMALMQKAIRRGHQEFALQGAATLLQSRPDWLWRRLCIIAFEDVAVADLDTVGLVTAALGGKNVRAALGGEWAVASFLIDRLVQSEKCRATDDLLMVAGRHPEFERSRLTLTFKPLPALLQIATDDREPLPLRALALWYSVGTDRCSSPHLRARNGAPQTVFDALCESHPHSVVEIAREGFRRTGEIHSALLVPLMTLRLGEATAVVDDDLPPEVMCGPVPSWALDMFTREGLHALRRFLKRDCPSVRWINQNIPEAARLAFVGNILFAVESGLVKRRCRWAVGEVLRQQAEVECQGPHCRNASEILGLLRADLPLLNRERGHVL